MMTIEFTPEHEAQLLALAADHPEHVKQAKARHSIGGGDDFTILISLAGLAIPAIRAIVLAHIRAGQYKSVSYKGLKITGHSADDISKILASLRDSGVKE
jgi:hypothetical protein